MKNIPIPYLRTLLLLTLFVGLLGVAKTILLNKVGNMNKPLAGLAQRTSAVISQGSRTSALQESSTEQKSSPEFYVWSSQGTPAKYSSWEINSPATKPRIEPDSKPISIPVTPAIASVVGSVESGVENSVEDGLEKNLEEDLEKDLVINNEDSPIETNSSFQDHLAIQAELRLLSDVTYDGRYLKIGYPMGDVPQNIGVCTDVVIRSFRGLGIDLQQRVHEDMKRNFRSYPNNWQLSKPDTNIDHRRVPNLMTYFKRVGASLTVTHNPSDYHVGDIVTWDLSHGLTHIGIVSNYVSELSGNPLIVHNIGEGPELNDMLFKHKIIGHYNYGDAVSGDTVYGEHESDKNKLPKQYLTKTILESLEKNLESFVFATDS